VQSNQSASSIQIATLKDAGLDICPRRVQGKVGIYENKDEFMEPLKYFTIIKLTFIKLTLRLLLCPKPPAP
jgi:hypothetical protein